MARPLLEVSTRKIRPVHAKIGLYYAGPNHWTSSPSKALDFHKVQPATQFVFEEKLANTKVVRSYERPSSQVISPPRPPGQAQRNTAEGSRGAAFTPLHRSRLP